MNIEDIDWTKILLRPIKNLGYKFSYNMSKLIIKTPELHIPFGIELYNRKEILNFSLIDNNNERHNFIHYIKTLEKIFEEISNKKSPLLPFIKFPPDFIKDINQKENVKTLRSSNNSYLLRTHLSKNTEIIKLNNNKKIYIEKKDILNKKCSCELELSRIWIYKNKYGLLWNVNKIVIA